MNILGPLDSKQGEGQADGSTQDQLHPVRDPDSVYNPLLLEVSTQYFG